MTGRRPQLTRADTSHQSTRYEVEFYSLGKYWALDQSFDNIPAAKVRNETNHKAEIASRIIIVSETRKLLS